MRPRIAFNAIKEELLRASTLVIMNEVDPLILYTDASTKAVGGVLMQVQIGKEMPCVFISHVLSEQATRWGIMELELYALVHCVKQLAPYLLGRPFTVKTDYKNLLYLSNSTIPKLVRWRVILSEYQFVISHIPSTENVVADGLTRVFRTQFYDLSKEAQQCVKDDTIPRIFRLEGEGVTLPTRMEMVSDSNDEEIQSTLPNLSLTERFSTFG
jgi:RNase H-like domain found in reverse transcriptase